MYHIWSFFTRKRNFSYLVLVALTVAGTFAVVTIQKESNPEVKVPIGIVTTTLPGASAADIETLITNEIEPALAGSLEQVNKITSLSSEGVSSITVEFNANADLDKSIQDLKDEVDTIKPELPEEANDPNVFQIDFSRDPVLTFAVAGDLPPSEFTKLGELLEDELKNVPGVASISISGLRKRETQVIVNADALRTYGLSLSDITGAIARTNATLPVGSIEFDGVLYNVEFDAAIDDPSQIDNIAVRTKAGQSVYIRDVAFVSDGLTEARTLSRVSVDGAPSQSALSFNVIKQAGGNVTDITTAVNERLAELKEPGQLLSGMEVVTIFDTGDLLIQDLTTLTGSGLLAVLLVMIILFLAIGWRESLVAGLSIPLSFMIAFVGLLMSGNTLNFVSLFALILSVGILVDSAIVIVEGTHTNMKKWMEKKEAALKTIRDFHAPVTAGTMTTVAVFVPLFFISGIVGEFIKSIPFTIISVLLASLLVALGFVPLIASLVLRRRTTSRLEELQEIYTKRALMWYKSKLSLLVGETRRENIFLAVVVGLFFATPVLPIKGLFAALLFCAIVSTALYYLFSKRLRWYLFAPGVALSLAVGVAAIAFIPPFATMQVEFFPGGDEDYLIVEMELPEGTVLEKSELEARKIEEFLYQEPDIESFVMTVGASSAFSGTGGSSGSKFANAFIQLREDRKHTSIELGDILADRLSAIRTSDIRVTQLAGGPPVGTPVVISFRGDNLDELEQLAIDASRILRTIEGTNAVTTSTKDDNTEFVLTIDKAKATTLGLDPSTIALILRTAIQGSEATTINTPQEDIDVIVKLNLNPDYRDPHDTNQVTIDAIQQIEIPTAGGSILLGSVLDAAVHKGNTSIRHEDERRIATASSELGENGNVAAITAEFERRAEAELPIPAGVEMIVGGENVETDQSFAEMGYAIIAGLILMFAIIVLMFNSFRHAIYVIAPAFLSFIGIAVGLTLTGNALSFPSLMGLIALVGIVVNNSIILIDVMNNLRREQPDLDIHTIVLEGTASRLRPIILTTLTTVIGIAPLLFASSLWAPLALSIIFGLSFAVIITLIMIPVLYHRKPGELFDENGDHAAGSSPQVPMVIQQ
jgi:multidrug efflux pump subunit AcrB